MPGLLKSPEKKPAAIRRQPQEQNPRPHQIGEQNPRPHQVGVQNPRPHQIGEQNPRPHQVGVQNPRPHQIGVQNPRPHQIGVQNPRPHQIGVQNPRPHQVGEQNPAINAPQPLVREPSNLLHFILSAEAAAGPLNVELMDERRHRLLQHVVRSMTVNVVQQLGTVIKVFDDVGSVTANSSVTKYTDAFYTIMECMDDNDIGNDFYRIGGFAILKPCLRCPHLQIKAGACELLAELCQSNPFCQMQVTHEGFLPVILNILDTEEDDDVRIKSLYALSCIVQENVEGCSKFLDYNGLGVMLNAIKRRDDRVRTKSAFFLNSLCRTRQDIIEKLINLGFIPVLIAILAEDHLPSHEHVLSLMKIMIENNPDAGEVCKDPLHDFRRILKDDYEFTKDKVEHHEEFEYCQHLLNRLFPGWNN